MDSALCIFDQQLVMLNKTWHFHRAHDVKDKGFVLVIFVSLKRLTHYKHDIFWATFNEFCSRGFARTISN